MVFPVMCSDSLRSAVQMKNIPLLSVSCLELLIGEDLLFVERVTVSCVKKHYNQHERISVFTNLKICPRWKWTRNILEQLGCEESRIKKTVILNGPPCSDWVGVGVGVG